MMWVSSGFSGFLPPPKKAVSELAVPVSELAVQNHPHSVNECMGKYPLLVMYQPDIKNGKDRLYGSGNVLVL